MSGTCHQGEHLKYGYVRFPSFYYITPYEYGRCSAETINVGQSTARSFDKTVDSFTWNADTKTGKKLSDAGFVPGMWALCRDIQAVGLK